MASGSVDKIRTLLQKAADQITTACDTLDAALVEATGVGGKLAQLIPPHVQTQIEKLTAIVEGEDQSALLKLDDLIMSLPYRDIAPTTASDRREKRQSQSIDLNPNTGSGPQTAVKESILSMYRKKEPEYKSKGLDFGAIRESQTFSSDFGEIDGRLIGREEVIDKFAYRSKIRETVENDDLEQLETTIRESVDGKGHFNWRAMNGIGGSLSNLSFDSLRDTGRDGMNLKDINIVN